MWPTVHFIQNELVGGEIQFFQVNIINVSSSFLQEQHTGTLEVQFFNIDQSNTVFSVIWSPGGIQGTINLIHIQYN